MDLVCVRSRALTINSSKVWGLLVDVGFLSFKANDGGRDCEEAL